MALSPTDFAVLDDFNRANTGPPAGPGWRNEGHWGDSVGYVTTSNQMAASGGGWRADSWATAYARSSGVGFGLTIATVGTGDVYYFLFADHTTMTGYALRYSGTTFTLGTFSGSLSTLDSYTQALSAGDGLGLIADSDDHVTAWHRTGGVWTKKADVTNTAYTGSLYPGMSAANTAARWDDMWGGNPTGGPPPPTATIRRRRGLLGVGR